MFPEQLLGHRLDAVDAAAQVDTIEIELEDLFLAQKDFEHYRERRFLRLAGEGARIRKIERPRQLLGDRAAPLHLAARAQVEDRRARDGDRIDAEVRVVAVILD